MHPWYALSLESASRDKGRTGRGWTIASARARARAALAFVFSSRNARALSVTDRLMRDLEDAGERSESLACLRSVREIEERRDERCFRRAQKYRDVLRRAVELALSPIIKRRRARRHARSFKLRLGD